MKKKELIGRLEKIRERFQFQSDKEYVANIIKDVQDNGIADSVLERLKTEGYGFGGTIAERSGWNSIEEAFAIYDVYRDWYPMVRSAFDVGGGMGLFYQYLETGKYPVAKDYYAIDISEAMVKGFIECFPKMKDRIVTADIVTGEARFLDRFYDMITMYGVTGDLGFREDMTKWEELGTMIDKLLPIASKVMIITFPDDWEVVQPKDGMPLTTWSSESVDKFFDGVEGYKREKICEGLFSVSIDRRI